MISSYPNTPIPIPYVPERLPQGWRVVAKTSNGFKYRGPGGYTVITSAAIEDDGRRWIHASIAHRDKLPTYDHLKLLHRVWFPTGTWCYQVFAPPSNHVNLHAHCLHLFGCLDGRPLPDFSYGTGRI